MAMKKKRRRRAGSRRRRPSPAQRLRERLSTPEAFQTIRHIALGALAAITLLLIAVFALRGDTNALYVLTLASGSLALSLGALPNWKLGLTAIFLYTQPLLIYLGNTEYGYTKAIYSLGFISLLAVVWVGELALRGRGRVQLTSLIWPALAVVGAALLSLINGESFLADVQYIVLIVTFIGFFLYVSNTVERLSEIQYLLGTLLFAAALASIYGLLQYYGVLPGAPNTPRGAGAIISTFGNKNYLGGFLAYLFVPGLVLLYQSASRWVRLLTLGALSWIFATLVAIDSDSAWLAVLLSIAVAAAGLSLTRSWDRVRQQWRWSAGLFGLAALLSLGLLITTVVWVGGKPLSVENLLRYGLPFSPLWWVTLVTLGFIPLVAWLEGVVRSLPKRRVWAGVVLALIALLGFFAAPPGQRVSQELWEIAVKSSAKTRAWDWWVGYQMFRTHPLVGIGLGDYKREFLAYKADFLTTERGKYYQQTIGHIQRAAQAHNEYVQILAEMGVVGALVVLFLLGALARSVWRRLRQAPSLDAKVLTLALSAGVIAFLSDSLFSFPLHLPANALAMVFLLGALQSRALGKPQGTITLGKRAARITAGIVLVIALIVSLLAYQDWRADYYLDLGMRQAKLGENEKAKQALEKSVQLDLAPAEALYWLGVIALREDDLARAREYFERTLPRFTTESGYYQLALVYFRLGELDQAKRYLDLLLAMDPSPDLKPDALYLQALLVSQTGSPEKAIELLIDAGKRYPNEEKFPVALAQVYLGRGEIEQAKQGFQQALAIVERKLKVLDQKLAPGRQVPIDDYSRWTAERENLRSLKEELETFLRRLSASSP
jgi:O-antigen ligase/Tfp pilus assembly protein PilF